MLTTVDDGRWYVFLVHIVDVQNVHVGGILLVVHSLQLMIWKSEWDWLFNVTFNDISVIYVMAGGLKKFDLRSGSQRHRHSVGFFNVPVPTQTWGQPFYNSEKLPHFSRLLRHAWVYGGHILDLTPPPRSPWRDDMGEDTSFW